jgi:hypothetical protein
MKIKSIFLIGTIFFSSFLLGGNTKGGKYTIEGHIVGFENGTMIFLNDISDGNYKKIDSTFVVKNKFSFQGSLKAKYLKVSITSTTYEDRVTFWIEGGITTFKGEKGNFKKAIITEGAIQKKME